MEAEEEGGDNTEIYNVVDVAINDDLFLRKYVYT